MSNFSTPELSGYVERTIDAVVAELTKQGVPVERNFDSDGITHYNHDLTMFRVVEEPPSTTFPKGTLKWEFRNLYLFDGRVPPLTIKGDNPNIVQILVEAVKARHERIVAANHASALGFIAAREAQSDLRSLYEAFPEYKDNISPNDPDSDKDSRVKLEFGRLTPKEAARILRAIKDVSP